ncbi:MAG: 50S ribosomal protein L22 [Verrucomicrobia bacterium]|nr:MAG: 50S ribosomal protein L22 [Verrucomicrobiota bacterium]
MQVLSIHRYAKISPFKAREVTREIQGKPALDALAQLKLVPKKAAPLILKVLKSAIANAENNDHLRPELLVIKEAVIGEAVTMKRMMTRARGSAGTIRKRTSHIRIVLTDEIPIVRRSDRPTKDKSIKKITLSSKVKKTVSTEIQNAADSQEMQLPSD